MKCLKRGEGRITIWQRNSHIHTSYNGSIRIMRWKYLNVNLSHFPLAKGTKIRHDVRLFLWMLSTLLLEGLDNIIIVPYMTVIPTHALLWRVRLKSSYHHYHQLNSMKRKGSKATSTFGHKKPFKIQQSYMCLVQFLSHLGNMLVYIFFWINLDSTTENFKNGSRINILKNG